MSWFDISRDNLKAARLAKTHGHWRTASSRAYYAAYAALTGEFEQDGTVQFRYEGNNPGHQQLLALAANNLDAKRYSHRDRREIVRSLKRLQGLRTTADYNARTPNADGIEEALISLRNAAAVLKRLGVLA